MSNKGTLRICENGHKFYKSSDCLVCPFCEKERTPAAEFLNQLSAPARRALENEGIDSPEKLAQRSKKEILKLHGMGKASIPKLHNALKAKNLDFRK